MSVMTKRKPMPSMESMRADRDADELVRHISELEGWGVKLEKMCIRDRSIKGPHLTPFRHFCSRPT